ncbi:MAG TPA: hypothetical protein VJX67_09115 [Blastocatellia bacterium]|nr:hypothetical protein [Blastocatellia bacterium]
MQVYIGEDRDMPVGQTFEVSMQPTLDASAKVVIPGSVPTAFRELQKDLPHWFLNALIRSAGEHGCSVILFMGGSTETDEMVPIESWYWVNWNLNSESSPLRMDFENMMLRNEVLIKAAFRSGFCRFLKTGDAKAAMDEVASYGN